MTAAEWIARRREIEQSATPGVWVAYHGGDTANIWGACPSFPCPEGCIDPMGHPDVLSMDETPRGDVEASWLPDAADLNFIADARTSLPKALDALEAALDLHKPREVEGIAGDCAAEECDHEDGKECERVTLTICAACDDFAERVHPYYAEQNWRESEYPCLVVTAITTALGVES